MSAPRLLLSRTAFRSRALGAGIGLSIGSALVYRQPMLRMDARAVPRPTTREAAATAPKERLDPEIIKQLSGGSITGFLTGLVISVFSKTLVLLLGASIVVVQVAARYGIDLTKQIKLRERIGNSKVLAALEKDPAFKLSFGFFFAMSAFLKFQNL
ncbi:hypothetical protein BKA67DRAFT_80701 [Truncatella angustata]|uniref:Fun14 family protein n=1 Tax=Truncatella angustata TaxID=152316 RepID=A0A9P9A5X1_9PEZI|nr:uncharacterized protein BKA67DRAFT_80701 [Truncatella angustata]KAH6661264.1 hypothetical protein BKA67DRAFT_80701 [Truncatella angustata]KAH8202221.1 hypothetical protein TruAng_003598 [Truncatella angustata]